MNRRVAVVLGFPLTILWCLALAAQEPKTNTPPPPPNESQDVVRINTNLVQVDVVVTRDGKPVTGLKAEDFELFEDGKSQAITSFTYVSNVAEPSASTAAVNEKNAAPFMPAPLAPNTPRRIVALVVDDLFNSFESVARVRKQIREFVEQKLNPNDLVAVIRTAGDVGALQQFTNDPRVLNQSLDRLQWSQCSLSFYVFAPIRGNTGVRDSSSGNVCGARDIGRINTERRHALEFILRSMRLLPGRKALVLFSDYMPIEQQGDPQSAPLAVDSFADDLTHLAELAIRASVVIYGVDTRGLAYTGITAMDKPEGNAREVMEQVNSTLATRSHAMIAGREGQRWLSRDTGGFLVFNSNDFQLPRIMNDQQGYYLLGYRPNDETFNRRFHEIKARLKRRGYEVRTRTGFWGLSETKRRDEFNTADLMNRALMSPFSASEIPLRLTAFVANDPARGTVVRSFVHLTPHMLTFSEEPDGSHRASFTLSSVIFGDNGRPAGRQELNSSVRLGGPPYDQALRDGIVYTFDMPVKTTGAFQFRVALRDATSGQIGSGGQYIEVPRFQDGTLSVTGLVVRDEASSLPTLSFAPNKIFSENILSGPALRRFQAGATLEVAYDLNNAPADRKSGSTNLTKKLRILHEGKTVFEGDSNAVESSTQMDPRRLQVMSKIVLAKDLAPGFYVLELVVSDPRASENKLVAGRWIDFEVVK